MMTEKLYAILAAIGTGCGAALAFRPRRRGTQARSAPVIQAQIVLAILGAVSWEEKKME